MFSDTEVFVECGQPDSGIPCGVSHGNHFGALAALNSPCMEGGNARQFFLGVFSDIEGRRCEHVTLRHYRVMAPGKRTHIPISWLAPVSVARWWSINGIGWYNHCLDDCSRRAAAGHILSARLRTGPKMIWNSNMIPVARGLRDIHFIDVCS